MKEEINCMGVECPIKWTCLRYKANGEYDIRKCTKQRLYLQDTTKINGDSLKR